MALRDCRAFDAWSVYGGATDTQWEIVRDWIGALAVRSYQAPSIPIPDLSAQPTYEVREATVPYSGGIYVLYRCFYMGDQSVDLANVGGFWATHWL